MNRIAYGIAVVVASLLFALPAFANPDAKDCTDYPGVSRMGTFFIDNCNRKQFESARFWVGPKDKEVQQNQEGRYFHYDYESNSGAPGASMVQIIRNYQNAVRAAGGQVMSDRMGTNWADTSLKLNKAGKEIWVLVEAHDNSYQLTIVEKQGMQQEVTMDAKAMGDTISQTGKVAIYGIYFDFAKANLKPESEPALNQIATLLKQNPKLNVYIVGHTDMVGDAATNVRLSQERAQSVIAALAGRYAIAPARLKPFGAGSYAPVASNRTDEGRAKNRRVELVEIAMK
jgi:outer membrane protein OmpA-like peptidoglycan-associated protein